MKKTIKENIKLIHEDKAMYSLFTASVIVASSTLVLAVGMAIIGGRKNEKNS